MAIKKSRLDEKPEEKKEQNQEETIELTPKQLEEIIEAKLAKMVPGAKSETGNEERLVKMFAEAINKKDYELPSEFSYTDPADLDPDDMLEEPVVFWAPGFHVVIGDDKKNGRAIQPPVNRVIWFKPEGSRKVQNGKEVDIQIWSKFASYSKKEVEWLKNHSNHGIVFFTKGSTEMNVDLRYTQKLMQFANGLKNMEAHRVVKEAKDLGLTFTDDINMLRLGLAQYKTKEYMKQFETNEKALLMENAKADKLLKSN